MYTVVRELRTLLELLRFDCFLRLNIETVLYILETQLEVFTDACQTKSCSLNNGSVDELR